MEGLDPFTGCAQGRHDLLVYVRVRSLNLSLGDLKGAVVLDTVDLSVVPANRFIPLQLDVAQYSVDDPGDAQLGAEHTTDDVPRRRWKFDPVESRLAKKKPAGALRAANHAHSSYSLTDSTLRASASAMNE